MRTKLTNDNGGFTDFLDLKEGQLAQITDEKSSEYGHIIMRCYTGIISLTNPHITWGGKGKGYLIRILPAGATVTLTQE